MVITSAARPSLQGTAGRYSCCEVQAVAERFTHALHRAFCLPADSLPVCLLVRRSSDQWRQEISRRSSWRRGTNIEAKLQARGSDVSQHASHLKPGSVSASFKGPLDIPNSSTPKLVQAYRPSTSGAGTSNGSATAWFNWKGPAVPQHHPGALRLQGVHNHQHTALL